MTQLARSLCPLACKHEHHIRWATLSFQHCGATSHIKASKCRSVKYMHTACKTPLLSFTGRHSSTAIKDVKSQHMRQNCFNFKATRFCSVFTGESLSEEEEEVVNKLFKGIIKQERGSLSRGITLVESTHPRKLEQAQLLLSRILRYNKKQTDMTFFKPKSFRIGNHFFLLHF